MSQHEKSDLYKEGYQAGKADAKRLDEPSIHTLVDSMPGGLKGFLKGWGWLNFARAVEDESILLNSPTPQADAAPLTSIKSAYVDWDLVERMRNAEEIDSEEAGMIGAMMDAQSREIDRLRAAIAAGGAQEPECTCAAKDMPFGRCCKAPPILANEHRGMRVDYSGLFKQATGALTRGMKEPALAEMLRQLQDHLTELGQRWYAGDAAVVDELLQLYCVERDARVTLAAPAAASNGEKK
jgi:hypothetical protein